MLDDALNSLDELRSALIHGMDVEQSNAAWLFINHVVERQIDEEVVVGLSPLQERLAALDVLAESRHILPLRVVWCHIDRSIESPAWPFGILRRIARTMEEHMVHTGHEHQVDVGFAL